MKEGKKKQKRVLCIYCKKPIHIDRFAGVTKKSMICSDLFCLITLAKELQLCEKSSKKENKK